MQNTCKNKLSNNKWLYTYNKKTKKNKIKKKYHHGQILIGLNNILLSKFSDSHFYIERVFLSWFWRI